MDVDLEGVVALIALMIVCGIVVVGAFFLLAPLFTQETVVINVTEKIPYHDGKYLITAAVCDRSDLYLQNDGKDETCDHYGFTNEVFAVADEIFLLKFDASDRYMNIKQGNHYTVKVCGYRIQLLSMYRNIYQIEG